MILGAQRGGLGDAAAVRKAVWSTVGGDVERYGDPCAPSPAWCSLVPFSDFMTECHPINPEACQKSGFGPALTPENRAAALKKGKESEQAYLRMNPDMAAAYQHWLDFKWAYSLNPAAAGPGLGSDVALYAALAIGTVGGLMLLRG